VIIPLLIHLTPTSPQSSPERKGGIRPFPFQGKAGDEVVSTVIDFTVKKLYYVGWGICIGYKCGFCG